MTKRTKTVVTTTEFFIREHRGNDSVYRRPNTAEVMTRDEMGAYCKRNETATNHIVII